MLKAKPSSVRQIRRLLRRLCRTCWARRQNTVDPTHMDLRNRALSPTRASSTETGRMHPQHREKPATRNSKNSARLELDAAMESAPSPQLGRRKDLTNCETNLTLTDEEYKTKSGNRNPARVNARTGPGAAPCRRGRRGGSPTTMTLCQRL